MATTGFILIGTIAFLSALIGVGLYFFIKKNIQKRNASWIGIIFSGLIAVVIGVTAFYIQTKTYVKNFARSHQIGCFYKVSNADRKMVATLLLMEKNSVSQDLCFQKKERSENEFTCRRSEKILTVNRSRATFDGKVCKHISEFPQK